MIINKKNNVTTNRVKFISYSGKYPSLCKGTLILEIDGKEYKFGHNYDKYHWDDNTNRMIFTDEDPKNPNFNRFWSPKGSVSNDGNWNWDIRTGEWEINVEEIPEQFRELAADIAQFLMKTLNTDVVGDAYDKRKKNENKFGYVIDWRIKIRGINLLLFLFQIKKTHF